MRRQIALALVLAGLLAQPAHAEARIVYAGDWLGPTELFLGDPGGKAPVRQLTFAQPVGSCSFGAACGFSDPTPSPNGRMLAYRRAGTAIYGPQMLYLARADGTEAHAVNPASDAAWSPDSRQLAYAGIDGIHVVAAGRDRLVDGQRVNSLAYSPDGRSLAFVSPAGLTVRADGHEQVVVPNVLITAFAWAGRRLAYRTPEGIFVGNRLVYRWQASDSAGVPVYPAELAATRDGRRLAFNVSDALRILDLRTLRVRSVAGGGHDLAWSPDGRRLLWDQTFDSGASSFTTGNVLTADLAGHVRVAIPAAKAYGGQIAAATWMIVDPRARYRAPAHTNGAFAGGPVQELVADGPRVAFIACGNVSVWAPATGDVEAVTRDVCQSPGSRDHRYSLALAGDRLAWWEKSVGLVYSARALTETLGTPPLGFWNGSGLLGDAPLQGTGSAIGAGSLLVFGRWSYHSFAPSVVDHESIERLEPRGCPCTTLAAADGQLVPFDIDANRVVVGGSSDTRVVAADGTTLLRLPVPATAGQLDGDTLVLAVGSELRVYDASSGALSASWPLMARHHCDLYGEPNCRTPPTVTLDDAAHGLAVYVANGEVHTLRLADGVDRDIGPGTVARFCDAGLVYADGARIRVAAG